ncbi:TetR/AcrR family transcriptional regulator [Mycobacterium sp. ACS4331]|uniref:TetR/AcrR family transcriptional regulator n=1 Tax=Mycobacterium sp. ACS4331 TaxID=1834121 RepID=UPI0007FBF094|nr:TetR/AcrR family transcriptional regulator [Mycobacterium sp. ACS4331]OBF12397.1 TetR family transcriptional regulator [Mycobacterium sp. ACS4331]
MADPATASENNEVRRVQMLRAAAELIAERGFAETRIADVAHRAGVSAPLVIYYFGTRNRLLVDALRHSEESFYAAAAKSLADAQSLRARLALLIRWMCTPDSDIEEIPGASGLWLELWPQAYRNNEVWAGRVELDARWRGMIVDAVESARPGEVHESVDARHFALAFSALLDGLFVQVALEDPEVCPEVAYRIAMRFAERELGLPPAGPGA